MATSYSYPTQPPTSQDEDFGDFSKNLRQACFSPSFLSITALQMIGQETIEFDMIGEFNNQYNSNLSKYEVVGANSSSTSRVCKSFGGLLCQITTSSFTSIPSSIFNLCPANEPHTTGLFQQLPYFYLFFQNKLCLWNYEQPGSQPYLFTSIEQTIRKVQLVKADKNVFVDAIDVYCWDSVDLLVCDCDCDR